ncbi:hypothetical protein CGZ93_05350 [Enemella dayhoffiae]|uniref:Tetratricopeptide repeat protein n=1 Tax=Enemella dayhoffiae TaxID=2016507 RepID=A0A255H8C6_9ACTN|nr:hypothetical protein [Enemella dayhoffiae]OYO23938.1 hypothetical protein CGZ93_05350 [Enemella dayhoffiae]
MTRKPLTDDFIDAIAPFDEQAEQAIGAGDGTALAAATEQIWDRMPTPRTEHDLQALVGWCTNSLQDLGNWTALQKWVPRYAEQYGDDDPSTRVLTGISAYHDGDRAKAQEILAGVLADFGPSAFEGNTEYLRVAKGGQLS